MVAEEEHSTLELASESVAVPRIRDQGGSRQRKKMKDNHHEEEEEEEEHQAAAEEEEEEEMLPKRKPRQRKKDLHAKILKQMEFYFSDANLSKDRYLGNLIKQDPYVEITKFLGFNRIRSLTQEVERIAKVVKTSSVLRVSEDGTKVGRITPILEKTNSDECTIYVQGLPPNADHDLIGSLFSQYGPIAYVSIPKYKVSKNIKGFAFIEFDKQQDADNCIKALKEEGCALSAQTAPETLSSITTFEEDKEAAKKMDDDGEEAKDSSVKKDNSGMVEREEETRISSSSSSSSSTTTTTTTTKNEQVEEAMEIVDAEDQAAAGEASKKMSKKKKKNTKKKVDEEEEEEEEEEKGEGDEGVEKKDVVAGEEEEKKKKKRKADEEESVKKAEESGDEETCKAKKARIEEKIGEEKGKKKKKSDEKNEKEEESEEKKKKRKRKKHGKSDKLTVADMGLQAMTKKDWKRLRNKYLNLQRQKMHELKMHLRKARWNAEKNKAVREDNEEKVEQIMTADGGGGVGATSESNQQSEKQQQQHKQNLVFAPGVVVKIEFTDISPDSKTFKEEMRQKDHVKYVDFTDCSLSAHVRFDSSEAANEFAEKSSTNERKISLIKGEEEKSYWEKAMQDRKQKLTKNVAQMRGKNKLLKKAEKELGKHIRFDEA